MTVGKQTSGIKNKIARSELYGKLKHHKALERKKKRVARQKEEERALAAGETSGNLGMYLGLGVKDDIVEPENEICE